MKNNSRAFVVAIATFCVSSLLLGCSAKNEASSSGTQKILNVEYVSHGEGVGFNNHPYIFSEAKDTEYVNMKSLEKLKRAVVILIEKVDGFSKNAASKQDVVSTVEKHAINVAEEIDSIKSGLHRVEDATRELSKVEKAEEPSRVVTEINSVNEVEEDDKKILDFINRKTKGNENVQVVR